MFQKLNKVGVTGNVLKIIKHMYSTTELCIRKEHFISNPIANNKGVKQGDSLSPTLFNIYINDLGSYVYEGSKNVPVLLGDSRLNHLLFADDLLLLSETSNGLQNCLNKLGHFWKLDVNLNKTKIMIFSNGRRNYENYNFIYNGHKLHVTDTYKYLVITLFYDGNLKHAADDLYNKALKAMFSLKKKAFKFFPNFLQNEGQNCLIL